VGQGAKVQHGLDGIDQVGKAPVLEAAVHMLDRHRLPGDAFNRMQDHEASPAGLESVAGGTLGREGDAVAPPFDASPIGEALPLILGFGAIADREPVGALVDMQVVDRRIVGAPLPVPDDERDRPDDLDRAEPDMLQVAGVEFRR